MRKRSYDTRPGSAKALVDQLDAARRRASTDYAPLDHEHSADEITSGVLDGERIATGTPDGTKFLRDDQVWTAISASGVTVSLQVFALADTGTNWTKGADTKLVFVKVVGAGAGGGCGYTAAAGGNRGGGTGGGGGAVQERLLSAGELPATVLVTVGAGGTGGVDGGAAATAGGMSSCGTDARAYGGGPGAVGASASRTGGSGGGS